MTQLLIVGSKILAQGPLTQDADYVYATDIVCPKHVIGDYQLVEAELPAGFACAGYEWLNGALSQKAAVVIPPVVPQSVTRLQGLIALDDAGYTPAINAIKADPTTPYRIKLALENAQDFERDSAALAVLAEVLGMTDNQVDQLFIVAAGIVA